MFSVVMDSTFKPECVLFSVQTDHQVFLAFFVREVVFRTFHIVLQTLVLSTHRPKNTHQHTCT